MSEQRAAEQIEASALRRRLAVALLEAEGEVRPEDGVLLWYLGGAEAARAALERAWEAGWDGAALPLWLLERERSPSERVARARELMERLSGSALCSFIRAAVSKLWLGEGRRDAASEVAVAGLKRDARCGVMPPSAVEDVTEVVSALHQRARAEMEPRTAVRALCLATLRGVSSTLSMSGAGFELSWLTGLWGVDHSTLDRLDAAALEAFAGTLSDSAEARAMTVLSLEARGRRSPLEAARGYRELAEVGADELFAVARVRSQRGFVAGGSLLEASEVALIRADFCADERLAHTLMLLSALYDREERPRRARKTLARLVRACLERRFRDAERFVSPILEMLEVLTEEVAGAGGLRALYDELEGWLQGTSTDVFRRYERLLVQGDALLLMPVVQLLQQTASVEELRGFAPAAFELAFHRVDDETLAQALGAMREDEALGSLVEPLLGWLRGTSALAQQLAWWEGGEHVARLGSLCADASALPVRFAASLALAEYHMRRGGAVAARERLVVAAELARDASEESVWRGLAARLARLSGDEGLSEAIAGEADERRFLSRLAGEDEALALYRRAQALGAGERGAELLGEAARLTSDGWLRARLHARAAMWLAGVDGGLERAAEASRAAWRAEPTSSRLVEYALRLAAACDFEALGELFREGELEWSAALVDACLAAWREGEDERAAERLEVLLREELERRAQRVSMQGRLYDAWSSLMLERGRVADARRGLLRVAHVEEAEALHAQASLRLGAIEAEHFDDADAAMAHLRRALVWPKTRPRALELMGTLYTSPERVEELIAFLLSAAEEAGELAAESDCVLAAAELMANRLEAPERAAVLLERMVSRQPERARVLELQVSVLLALERVPEARAALSALVEITAGEERARHRRALAGVLASSGDAEEALSMEIRAFDEAPLGAAEFKSLARRALELGCQVEFVRLHNVAIRALRQHRFEGMSLESLYARKAAVELVALQRHRDAARSLIDALRLNPDEASYLQDIEGIAAELGEPVWTARAWEARLEAWPPGHPERGALHRELAELYAGVLSLPGRAAEHLLEAREHTNSAEARDALIAPIEALLEQVSDPRRERAWLERRLGELSETEPDVPELMERLARVLLEAGDSEAAREQYMALQEREPERVAPGTSAFASLLALCEESGRLRDTLGLVLLETKATPAGERCPLLLRLGGLYTRLGEVERAERCYRTALSLAPDSGAAVEGVAQVLEARGDWESLMVLLEEVSRRQPSAVVLLRMARLARERLSAPERAAVFLERALALGSTEATLERLELAVSRGEWARASELAQGQVGEVESLGYLKAIIARGLGRESEALSLLEATLAEDPQDERAWSAWCEIAQGAELPGASTGVFLEHHLSRLPKGATGLRVEVCCVRARLAERRGDIDGAFAALARARREAPGGESLRETVRLKLRLGATLEAEQLWLSEARRFEPGSMGWARASLEAVCVRVDRLGDGAGARAALEAIAQSDAASSLWPRLGFVSAQAWALEARFEEAASEMRRVLADFDMATAAQLDEAARLRAAHHHFYLGRMLAACSEHDEAASCYAVALALDPEHPSTRLAALQNLLERGDWEHFDVQCRAAASRLEGSALARLCWLEAEAAARCEDVERRRRALRTAMALETDPERMRSAALALAAVAERPRSVLLEALARAPRDAVIAEALIEASPERAPEALLSWSSLLRGAHREVVPSESRRLDREALRLCGAASLSASLGAVLRVLRPLLLEEVARLERPSGERLEAAQQQLFRRELEHANARLSGLQMPVISGWSSRTGVSAVVLVPGEGYRIYVPQEGLESPWLRAAIARCVALHAWSLEPVWHLPEAALMRWCVWLEERRGGRDVEPPSGEIREQDVAALLSVLGSAKLSEEHVVGLREGLARSLDRVAWVALGALEEALLAMAPRGMSVEALPMWVEGSEAARALLAFAVSGRVERGDARRVLGERRAGGGH